MCFTHTDAFHNVKAQALSGDPVMKLDPVAEALATLVARNPERLLPHMHFEGDFCIGCDWRRIDLQESSKVCPLA